MSKIIEALSKLDPKNDNHWTSDGLPRIDTVKMLATDQTLTRESITAASPEFTRQTALASLEVNITTSTVATEVVVDLEVKDYAALQEAAQEELQAAIIARDEAQALVYEKQNALDDVINERHAAGEAEHPMTAISGYLASQQGVLQERARRHAVLVESGVTLQDIQNLIPQRAPLDIALSGKKK